MKRGKCDYCGKYKRNLEAHWFDCWMRKKLREQKAVQDAEGVWTLPESQTS